MRCCQAASAACTAAPGAPSKGARSHAESGLTHFTAGDRRAESHIAGVAAEGHMADGDQQERRHRCTAGAAHVADESAAEASMPIDS